MAMMILVPINIASLVIIIPVIYKIRAASVGKARGLRRVEAVTRSPIFTMLNDGYSGLVQIRCYKW